MSWMFIGKENLYKNFKISDLYLKKQPNEFTMNDRTQGRTAILNHRLASLPLSFTSSLS